MNSLQVFCELFRIDVSSLGTDYMYNYYRQAGLAPLAWNPTGFGCWPEPVWDPIIQPIASGGDGIKPVLRFDGVSYTILYYENHASHNRIFVT